MQLSYKFVIHSPGILNIIYTIDLHISKMKEWLVHLSLLGSSQLMAKPSLPGKELCYTYLEWKFSLNVV